MVGDCSAASLMKLEYLVVPALVLRIPFVHFFIADDSYNNNINDFISIALFHVKHAQLR